jgi:hypothetical protein
MLTGWMSALIHTVFTQMQVEVPPSSSVPHVTMAVRREFGERHLDYKKLLPRSDPFHF